MRAPSRPRIWCLSLRHGVLERARSVENAMKLTGRRARCGMMVLAGVGLIWLAHTAVRSRALLAQGRIIESQSASFARDYFVGQADAPTLRYLAMGDSTAAGWGAAKLEATYSHLVAQAMAKRGFRVHVVNLASGGAAVSDVRANQLDELTKFAPDLITLSVGANDATRFTSMEDYRRDLNAILSALKQSSAPTILVADTPDMRWLRRSPSRYRGRVRGGHARKTRFLVS